MGLSVFGLAGFRLWKKKEGLGEEILKILSILQILILTNGIFGKRRWRTALTAHSSLFSPKIRYSPNPSYNLLSDKSTT